MTQTPDGSDPPRPLRLAVIDDFEVVVAGVARLMEPHADRVQIVELDVNTPVSVPVDIALIDTFGQGEAHTTEMDDVLHNPLATRVVIYTWRVDDRLVDMARARGFDGYLSKQLGAAELVGALERIHSGRRSSSRPVPTRPDLPTRPGSGPVAVAVCPNAKPKCWCSSPPGAAMPRSPTRCTCRRTRSRPMCVHCTARSTWHDAPTRCCGESTTASGSTTAASTTGARCCSQSIPPPPDPRLETNSQATMVMRTRRSVVKR